MTFIVYIPLTTAMRYKVPWNTVKPFASLYKSKCCHSAVISLVCRSGGWSLGRTNILYSSCLAHTHANTLRANKLLIKQKKKNW